MERRLVVIFACDVVGYSRLMRMDEEATLADLVSCRELVDKLIESHGGRIFNTAGDSVLAEFSSPVETIRCAVAVQRGMEERNTGKPENTRMRLRIGVNLGDVIAQNGDMFGDGVNVAARLETLSEPSGICISQAVYEQVRDRLDITFEDFGPQTVKNIDRPVRVYRWSPNTPNSSTQQQTPDEKADTQPVIAVLPFENISGDPEQDYLADGISEEIITTLSQVPDLLVLARNSTFSYKNQTIDVKQIGKEQGASHIVEGTVRIAGKRMRISTQLVDTQSGHHLWAERYDRTLDDIFELQDEIALRIANSLLGEVLGGEMARMRGRGTRNLEAWAYHIRAISLMQSVSAESYLEGRRLAEKAVCLDPAYSAALSTIALTHGVDARHGFSASRERSIRLAREFAHQAIEHDPDNSEAYGILGFADTLDRDVRGAVEKFQKSLGMNPNHAEINARLGLALIFDHRADEAVKATEKALRLCPKHPPWFAGINGFALRSAGRYDEAIEAFRLYGRLAKGFGHVDLAIVHVMKGDLEAARKEAAKLLAFRPDFRVSEWAKTQLYEDQDGVKPDTEALLAAGLPA